MTAAVLARPGSLFDEAATRRESPAGQLPVRPDAHVGADTRERPASTARPFGRGRVTLEECLDAVLHSTRANGSADCPVCDARMTFTRAGAECGVCGARLT